MTKNRVDGFIKNPRKALFTLAMPVVIGMVVHSLYNIIDTIFVGRLGAEAIAAVTLSFPFFFIMNAFAFGIGVGVTSVIGKLVGQKRKGAAANAACHGIIISLGISIVFFIAGLLYLKTAFAFIGAEAMVTSLGIDYMRIIFLFAPVFFLSPAFYAILSGEGDTKTPMKLQIFSLITNIILDPIFIFGFGYGVKGAAIATVIAQTLGFLIFCYIFFVKKSGYLKADFRLFSFRNKLIYRIFFVGAPVILTHLIMGFGVLLLNKVMTSFSTNHIAAFGLAVRFDSLVVMPVFGISSGLVALVSMYLGAKRPDLIRYISWYGIKMSLIIVGSLGVIIFFIPEILLSIFTQDPELIKIGSVIMRFLVFTYPFMAIGMNTGRIIQGLGTGIPSLIITSARVLVFAIPLAYTFVYILGYGYTSVLWALIISANISAFLAIPWLRYYLKKINESPM